MLASMDSMDLRSLSRPVVGNMVGWGETREADAFVGGC